MISVPTFSSKGVPGEKVKLPEALFGVKADPRLIAQAVRVYLGNQRQAGAKTKTRGEIKKTTAKMYKQKGTGRARHGSHSAPIFVGGGVSHGPTGTQNFKHTLSTAQRRLALFSALSDKAKSDLLVVTGLKNQDKTEVMQDLIQEISKVKLLFVVASEQKILARAIRNLKNVKVISAGQLNTYWVLSCQKIAMTSEAIEELSKIFNTK